jgi:hypothetical protein
MADQKRNFVFTNSTQVHAPVDQRVANALEFIAHYLDRIDGHLESLAAEMKAGRGDTTTLTSALQSIAHMMGETRHVP